MNTTISRKLPGLILAACLSVPTATLVHAQSDNQEQQNSLNNIERANRIIGRQVRTTDNERVGEVDDIVVDLESGRMLYAVVSTRETRRQESQRVAVPASALTPNGNRLRLAATRAQLRNAPQFTESEDRQSEMYRPTFARNVYQHFGQTPWWEANPNVESFGNAHRVSNLRGLDVLNVSNQKIGEVDNVLMDFAESRVALVVLDPDRSLNADDNLLALPPMALTRSAERNALVLGTDQERLASAPRFRAGQWEKATSAAFASQAYEFFGKQPYFRSGTAQSGPTRTDQNETQDRALARGAVERANDLIGRNVATRNGDSIGEIEDVVVALESGRVLYAVVSAGGFLGVGDRLVAVPLNAFSESGQQLQLDADREKLMSAPQFGEEKERRPQMFSPDFVSLVFKHFGETAWFENFSQGNAGRFGNAHRITELLGMDVKNVSNAEIGEVENVAIDLRAGRVAFVILDPHDRLNLNHELYALPPMAFTQAAGPETLTLGVDQSRLASAPGFNEDNWPDLSSQSFASRIYQFYGKEGYFGDRLRPTSDR